MEKRRETLDTTTPASIEMVVTNMPNTTIVNFISFNYFIFVIFNVNSHCAAAELIN